MNTEVFEKVKAMRNRCELLMFVMTAYPDKEIGYLIPTALEDIHEKSQDIVEGHCIEHEQPA